jgi:ribosome-associated translation inhibitor RaiA
MEIKLTIDGFDLTDEQAMIVRDKFEAKLDPLLEDYAPDVKTATMTIKKRSRWGYKMKFTMVLPGKEYIHADTVNDSLETGVVDLKNKIERQIKKYKSEIRS